MGTFRLVCHPKTPASGVHGIVVEWVAAGNGRWLLRWDVEGAAALLVPPPAPPMRTAGLWQTTCFELFLADEHGYREFNFAPSGAWAAYRFTGYRAGMSDLAMPDPPVIGGGRQGDGFACTVGLPSSLLEGARRAALSAVIEEADGTKSYWALAHAPGDPDFHNPACFTVTIAAAEGA